MHSFRFSRYKAFTLVEVMVVIAIFTIVIGAAYALMASGRMSWYSGDARIELQEDLRQAMDVMTYELSASAPTRVDPPGAGGTSVTFQIPVDENATGSWEDTDVPPDGVADFYLEDILDASNNVRWGAYLRGEDHTVASNTLPFGNRADREITFLRVGDELRRRTVDPTVVPPRILEDFLLADDIQNLNFVRPASNVIVITVDAGKLTIDRHPIVYTLSTTVYLKSKE